MSEDGKWAAGFPADFGIKVHKLDALMVSVPLGWDARFFLSKAYTIAMELCDDDTQHKSLRDTMDRLCGARDAKTENWFEPKGFANKDLAITAIDSVGRSLAKVLEVDNTSLTQEIFSRLGSKDKVVGDGVKHRKPHPGSAAEWLEAAMETLVKYQTPDHDKALQAWKDLREAFSDLKGAASQKLER